MHTTNKGIQWSFEDTLYVVVSAGGIQSDLVRFTDIFLLTLLMRIAFLPVLSSHFDASRQPMDSQPTGSDSTGC